MPSTISGYVVKTELNGIPYTIFTKEGFRGFNIPCVVWYSNKSWHVVVQGRKIPVDRAVCNLKIEAHDRLNVP